MLKHSSNSSNMGITTTYSRQFSTVYLFGITSLRLTRERIENCPCIPFGTISSESCSSGVFSLSGLLEVEMENQNTIQTAGPYDKYYRWQFKSRALRIWIVSEWIVENPQKYELLNPWNKGYRQLFHVWIWTTSTATLNGSYFEYCLLLAPLWQITF